MVPYNNPIPEKQRGKADEAKGRLAGGQSLFGAWIQAEKMIQIVLVLPCAAFIGWLTGYGLDRWLHQTWISIAGIVFGIIAGLVGAIRMAVVYTSGPGRQGGGRDETGKGSSNPPS